MPVAGARDCRHDYIVMLEVLDIRPFIDGSMVFITTIAVCCVFFGAYWSSRKERAVASGNNVTLQQEEAEGLGKLVMVGLTAAQ